MKTILKVLFALVCFIAATAMCAYSEAGCRFCQSGSRTVVTVAPEYSMSYGYSEVMPSYRTYRVYRRVPTMVVAPQVGYAVPNAAPAYVEPPQPADPAPVMTYSEPVQSQAVYAVDDADVVRVRHKERHRHGKHKIKHAEVSR